MSVPLPGRCRVGEVPWETLAPDERTVLCFISRGGEVLLIRKKTGLGAGMLNAPGGRMEKGETPPEAAIRETREETGLTPESPQPAGSLLFYFTSGYYQSCEVFSASGCRGEAVSTPEADPIWVPRDQIPYERMWEGDRLWIPLLLRGIPFSGKLIFAEEKLLDSSFQTGQQ